MSQLFQIAAYAIKAGASDIHLSCGNRPTLRIDGAMQPYGNEPPLNEDVITAVALECLGRIKFDAFLKTGDLDTAYEIPQIGRFRVNIFKQSRGISIVMRIIPSVVPEMDTLGLPPALKRVLPFTDGLVLVTGPTGSGKTTTLAALVNEFNKIKKAHIITIEDPIEYIHVSRNCIINQREVGADSVSYASALRASLHEDPDIILLGEMLDLESISIALTAAETGHLVLSTAHTIGAAKTIDRLIDVFPGDQQQQIRTQLSMSLRAVVSQRLLPRSGGHGRVGAFELMFVNNAISNNIRESKTVSINQIIQTGLADGMLTFERSASDLYRSGLITQKSYNEFMAAAAGANRTTATAPPASAPAGMAPFGRIQF